MKILKVVTAAVNVWLLFSCVNKGIDVIGEQSDKMVTVRLSTVDPPEFLWTRTVLDDELNVSWNHDDEVFLTGNRLEDGLVMKNLSDDASEGVFEATVSEEVLGNRNREIILYPAKVAQWSADMGTKLAAYDWGQGFSGVVLPDTQPMVPGTFAQNYNLSAATFEISDRVSPLYFHNLCGLLRVGLKGNATIKSIVITAPSKMNGVFQLMSDKALGEMTEYYVKLNGSLSSDTASLTSEEGIDLRSDVQKFYACVLPENIEIGSTENAGPGAGEYTVTVTTVEGKTVTWTASLTEGVSAAMISNLGEMEVNYTFADAGDIELDSTGEPVSLKYLVQGGVPAVEGAPEWLQYTAADGVISFTAGLYIGDSVRSADVTISQGEMSSTVRFSQKPVPTFRLSDIYSDADAHEDYMIEKTEYLTGEYTLEESSDWLAVAKDEAGNALVSIEANSTGVLRTGVVTVKTGGRTVGTINVIQTAFNYASLTGTYTSTFRHIDNSIQTIDGRNGYFRISERTADGSYAVLFAWNWRDYTMLCDYVPVGPGLISLICPQQSETLIGSDVSFIRAARKNGNSGFRLTTGNYKEIDVTEEGCGFDLVPVLVDGVLNFDFVPNEKARSLYPEGVDGLWFPEYQTLTTNPLTWSPDIKTVQRYIRPLDGQEYLRITKQN